MLRWVRRTAAITLAAAVVACGHGDAVTSTGGDGAASPGSVAGPPPPGPPQTFGAEIAGIRPGADGQSLVASVDGLPVEGAEGACAVELGRNLDFEADRIYLTVTYVTHYPDGDPAFGGCETSTRDITVDLGGPLAGRHVLTQIPAGRWIPGADSQPYGRCELPVCDPATGVAPLPVTCEDSTLADAARSRDVPRHAGLGNSHCELPWAVIDIDVGAGACPATGDGPNPCAGTNIRRTYWRADGYTWRQVGSSTGSGCGDIATIVPDFPRHLCEDMPPLP